MSTVVLLNSRHRTARRDHSPSFRKRRFDFFAGKPYAARFRSTFHFAHSEPYDVGNDRNTFSIQLSDRARSRTQGARLKIPRRSLVSLEIRVNDAKMRFFVNHSTKDGATEINRTLALLDALEATCAPAELSGR